MDDLIETWQAHNAINLYLLTNLPDGGFEALPTSGGDTVGQQFAHINDLRLRWISEAAADLITDLAWFEKQPERAVDAAQVRQALDGSGRMIEQFIRRCAETNGRVEGFPGSVTSFIGYLIAHESYHWGEIGLALTQSDRPLSPEVALGIWRGWWGREGGSGE